jgi:hypothetical protein
MEFRGPKKKMRKQVAANHGFRKFCHTTMTNAKINPEIREMLLGHSIGLSNSYYRPTVEEMLNEYQKVVNELTIDPSNRLQKKVEELKEKDDFQNYVIDKKMKEKDEQIKALQDSINFLSDTVNRALLADPKNKIITATPESDDGIVKGIELKPELNNKAIGTVIPSSTSTNSNNKKK